MKTTKELKIWSLRMVLFTILLSGLSVQKVYSFCNSTEIIINGKWYSNQEKVNTRSLPSIPITACIIRKSKFPQNPKRSVRFSGKGTKRSVQKRKARNTQKAETKVL